MIRGVAAVILWSARFDRCVAFYRAIGVPLDEERHDDSPVHWACELGDVHFAIYPLPAGAPSEPRGPDAAPSREQGGATMVGLSTDSLDDALAAALATGGRLLLGPESMPWGRRVVVSDPDGRSVEIMQA